MRGETKLQRWRRRRLISLRPAHKSPFKVKTELKQGTTAARWWNLARRYARRARGSDIKEGRLGPRVQRCVNRSYLRNYSGRSSAGTGINIPSTYRYPVPRPLPCPVERTSFLPLGRGAYTGADIGDRPRKSESDFSGEQCRRLVRSFGSVRFAQSKSKKVRKNDEEQKRNLKSGV